MTKNELLIALRDVPDGARLFIGTYDPISEHSTITGPLRFVKPCGSYVVLSDAPELREIYNDD